MFLMIYVLSKRYFHSLRTPISFFSLLWCLIGFLSNMGIYGYYPPSLFVNASIVIGAFLFFIAFCLNVKYCRNDLNEDWIFGVNEKIMYQRIYLVNGVGLLILIPKLINSLRLMVTYGMVFMRANLINQEIGMSYGGVYDNLVFAIIRPLFVGTGILASALIFNVERNKKLSLLLFSIALISCYCLSDATRGALIEFIFCLVLVVMVCKRNTIKALFKNRLAMLGFLLLAILVLCISSERTSNSEGGISNILETIYIYYCSGQTYLTKMLEAKPEYALSGKLLYGSASFGFITNNFSWMLILLTGKLQGSQYLLGTVITNTYYAVAPTIKINSMATCFYSFMLDWEYLDVFIGPILLGVVS